MNIDLDLNSAKKTLDFNTLSKSTAKSGVSSASSLDTESLASSSVFDGENKVKGADVKQTNTTTGVNAVVAAAAAIVNNEKKEMTQADIENYNRKKAIDALDNTGYILPQQSTTMKVQNFLDTLDPVPTSNPMIIDDDDEHNNNNTTSPPIPDHYKATAPALYPNLSLIVEEPIYDTIDTKNQTPTNDNNTHNLNA